MASRKRTISDIDTPSNSNDEDKQVIQKRLQLDDDALLSPSLHASVSLSYPSTSQPASHAVPFQRPLPLITFSYNKSRELEFSDAAMRYYVAPPARADLGYGYERWVRRTDDKGRLDGLLRAILETQRRGTGHPVIDVISWRGIMTKCVPATPTHMSCFTEPSPICEGES
jgi:RAT1-interacting protein